MHSNLVLKEGKRLHDCNTEQFFCTCQVELLQSSTDPFLLNKSTKLDISQNHKTVEVGMDLWRLFSPNPCSSTATWTQLPGTTSRCLLKIVKGEESLTSLSNLCRCLITLTIKICFPMLDRAFWCFSLYLLPLSLSLPTTGKSLAPSLFPLHHHHPTPVN